MLCVSFLNLKNCGNVDEHDGDGAGMGMSIEHDGDGTGMGMIS